MKLKLFKPLWGHIGSLQLATKQAVENNFDGIEGSVPEDKSQREQFADSLAEHKLELIGEIFTGGNYVPDPSASPENHLDDIKRKLELTLPLNPIFINTQAGLDAWPLKTSIAFYEKVLALAEEHETTISIELHRSRITHSPWVTRDIIAELPDLPLTIDFSHWCCVAERLIMNDEPELLQNLAKQTHHIHARVGYDQGPQVPDPRAPEYEKEVTAHINWWKTIWAYLQTTQKTEFTTTPEFGTDGYLHLEPYTQRPVADLWEINCWMAEKVKSEWLEFWKSHNP
ncbi:sugar phosphate isomerase/epimerase [Akkermansiaceae bacterium]|nr:sugar phosphate isomerase/epimerase [Akkermansiaceae bacterium]